MIAALLQKIAQLQALQAALYGVVASLENSAKELEAGIKLLDPDFKYDDTIISITLTIGISSSIKEKNTANMIKKADENLYKGKNKGKNCVIYE